MEFFKSNSNIHFYRLRNVAALFSIVLFLLSIGALIVFHLNLGLDFYGGYAIAIILSTTR